MALPIIPIAQGLISIAPSIAKFFGGDKAEDAAQSVVDIARQVTGQNDAQSAVNMVLESDDAKLKFLSLLEQRKTHLDEIYLADRSDAREMYTHHNEQADLIADRITKYNVLYILIMVTINCMVVYFFKEDAALVGIASNIIGFVIRDLLAQIQAVTGFYFGSSLGSKNKVSK